MKSGIPFARLLLVFLLAACAVITVNIYFPEKDVQEAYRALEKELMAPEAENQEGVVEEEPTSSLGIGLVAMAFAEEEGLAVKIAETIKRMPDVVEAYRQMGSRVADMDRVRDSGVVGEANTGLLVKREGAIQAGDEKLVEQENENRKTVIRGMAKAIIRINRERETPEALEQLTPQATEEFATLRRDSAKKGWWIQKADGNWTRK